jgi:hypothetical protein
MQISALPLQICLQLAGASMIFLGLAHLALPKLLGWKEDLAKLSPINNQIFIAHAAFIAVGIVLLGGVCLFFPSTLMERTELGRIAAICFAMCWLSRLIFQFGWFRGELSKAAGIDRVLRLAGTLVWIFYTLVFGALVWYQL